MVLSITVGVPSVACAANELNNNCTDVGYTYLHHLSIVGDFQLNFVSVRDAFDAHEQIFNGSIDTTSDIFAQNLFENMSWVPTTPVATQQYCIMYRNKKLIERTYWFLLPLDATVWYALFFVVLCLSIFYSLFYSTRDFIWSFARASRPLLNQTEDLISNRLSVRLFCATWLLTSYIIVQYYSASLLTYLLISDTSVGPTTLQEAMDAIESEEYSAVAFAMPDLERHFLAQQANKSIQDISMLDVINYIFAGLKISAKIKERMRRVAARQPHRIQLLKSENVMDVSATQEHLNDFAQQGQDIIVLVPLQDKAGNEDICSTKFSKVCIQELQTDLIYHFSKRSRNSKRKLEEFNKAITIGLEADLRAKLDRLNFAKVHPSRKENCKHGLDSNKMSAVSMKRVEGPLTVAGVGCGIALVALIVEISTSRFKKCGRRTCKLQVAKEPCNEKHWPIMSLQTILCKHCSKRYSNVRCTACDVSLCLTSEMRSNCFYMYHSSCT